MKRKDRLTQDQILDGIKRQKYRWIDVQMARLLPQELYRGMHWKDPQAQGRVKELGYHIEEDGDVITIMKGADVVARTRLVLELKSFEEMDMLAKVVKVVPPTKVDPNVLEE